MERQIGRRAGCSGRRGDSPVCDRDSDSGRSYQHPGPFQDGGAHENYEDEGSSEPEDGFNEILDEIDDCNEDKSDVEDLLKDMEEIYNSEEACGPNINDKLASSCNGAFRTMIGTHRLNDTKAKYNRPANCPNLTTPKVNIEVWTEAKSFAKTRDKSLQKVQAMMAKATIPVLEVTDNLITASKGGNTGRSVKDNVAKLTDAIKMQAWAFTELSQIRKDNFKHSLDKRYQKLCMPGNAVTTELFGDDLPKKIKDIHDSRTLSKKVGLSNTSTQSTRGKATGYHAYGHQGNFGRSYHQNFHGSRGFSHSNRGHFRSSPYQKPASQSRGTFLQRRGRQNQKD
ncbi:uncharacterized protein [Argopecten irradians]